MGDTFHAIKEGSCPPTIPYHQGGPVAVTVESKLFAAGSIVLDRPQHCGSVLLIERIVHVNEEKYPVILLLMMFP